MTKRSSTSYVCTLDVNSTVDMEKLAAIKATVSTINKDRSLQTKKRVVIRGRKPVEKREVYRRWSNTFSEVSYDWAGNIVGGIKNATKIDVYIYDRRC